MLAHCMPADHGRHLLLPHPVPESGPMQGHIEELAVTVDAQPSRLCLHYRLRAKLQSLQLPEPRTPQRTDGLWRHSCFEAFIGFANGGEYWEFNFSPSGAWASYHFNRYREGMEPLLVGAPPEIRRHDAEDQLDLDVDVDLSWLTRSRSGARLKLGLAAVIEDRAHVLSWWALKHPGPKPDFHHADGFAIELDLSGPDKLAT
jgi:hypothetical protein